MVTGKRPRAGLEVDLGGGTLPAPAVVGPLLGLAYILVLPFAGIAAFVAGIGRRGRDGLVTMWNGLAEPAVDAQEKAWAEAAGFREILQPLLDKTACEFVVVDRELQITQYHLPSSRQDRLLEQKAIGQHCFELAHGRNSPCTSRECECPVNRVLETNGPVIVMHHHESQPERGTARRAVEVIAAPVRDRAGRITHVAEFICDAASS